VSVNAILRASGVSRSGFYAHFTGLEDLLVGMLSDAFRDIAVTYSTGSHAVDADPARSARIAQEQLVAFVSDRRRFLRASLDWPVGSRAHEIIVQAYAHGVRDAIEARETAAPRGVDADDLATFLAGGAVALLTRWIREEDDDSTPKQVVVDRLLAVMPDWLVTPR
jgi:AcrR family transcriptional regulator